MTTLGELLDLIDLNSRDVVELLDDYGAMLRGYPKSYLWAPYRGRAVKIIRPRDNVLQVWLKEEEE